MLETVGIILTNININTYQHALLYDFYILTILSGFLRESTGSFRPPLIMCGVLTLGLGLNSLTFPLQKRWQKRIDRNKKKNKHNDTDGELGNDQEKYRSLDDV